MKVRKRLYRTTIPNLDISIQEGQSRKEGNLPLVPLSVQRKSTFRIPRGSNPLPFLGSFDCPDWINLSMMGSSSTAIKPREG